MMVMWIVGMGIAKFSWGRGREMLGMRYGWRNRVATKNSL